jgi:hypothetical protein
LELGTWNYFLPHPLVPTSDQPQNEPFLEKGFVVDSQGVKCQKRAKTPLFLVPAYTLFQCFEGGDVVSPPGKKGKINEIESG